MRIVDRMLALNNAIFRPDPADYRAVSAKELMRAYRKGQRLFHFLRLDGLDLADVDLCDASFYFCLMREIDLSGALLLRTHFQAANLQGANFDTTLLHGADFSSADLTAACFYRSDLLGSNFTRATCTDTDFRFARLQAANLTSASFSGARVTGVKFGGTQLTDIDLRPFCSAARVQHYFPSFVDSQAVMKSHSHPGLKRFLGDCGIPAVFSEYMVECAAASAESPVQKLMRSTFISYGDPDERFARELYNALRQHGITAFFFPESARVGERLSNEIHNQIQAHDRVLLVCSKKSLSRAGVINEIQETLDREARDRGASYLLPVMLDSYVLKDWHEAEPSLARRVRNRVIADFRGARRVGPHFSRQLDRIIDALKVKGPAVDAHSEAASEIWRSGRDSNPRPPA
jgi:hypothetical protein